MSDKPKSQNKADDIVVRGLSTVVEVRSIDEDTRTAEFVAATENGVDTWQGREFLRMSGANLKRFRKNPVVLDAHDRWSTRAVIGDAKLTLAGRELLASVRFATTAHADEIWQLVRDGFVRAVSVGFIPDAKQTVRLKDGESDGEGEARIQGPATVIKSWELLEISVVPVPADADAIRRMYCGPEGDEAKEYHIEDDERDNDMAENEQKGEEPAADVKEEKREQPVAKTLTPGEIAARDELARAATIRELAGDALRDVAEECVLGRMSIEDACQRLLEEHTKRAAAVGTPEPEPVPGEADDKPEMTDEKVERAIRLA